MSKDILNGLVITKFLQNYKINKLIELNFEIEDFGINTHYEAIEFMKSLTLTVNPYIKKIDSIEG